MSSRFTFHPRPATRRRNVLGLVAVLWLNMAVLPCAMAFQTADMCPHCPPDDEHEMAAHHGHGEDPAEPARPAMQGECCDVEEVNIDARVGKHDAKPASVLVFVMAPAIAELPTLTAARLRSATDPPCHSGSSPPLNVLYCVYLD